MVQDIAIKNFKSLIDLKFKAKKVNIFIGEPNTGKSNILEALGLFGWSHGDKGQIRYKSAENLFSDNDVTIPIEINASPYHYLLKYEGDKFSLNITENNKSLFRKGAGGIVITESEELRRKSIFKHYKFRTPSTSTSPDQGNFTYLIPPHGSNLFDILNTNKKVKEYVKTVLKEHGYQLRLRMQGKEIEVTKEIDEVYYDFPYQIISDTLQRIIFYIAIVETNTNSILLLEEPEAHTFPFYTKHLAERIALDENNQYFIVTHNPYFLISLVEKTNIDDLGVFVTYMQDYQTKVRPFEKNEYAELLDLNADIFFNLDKFLKNENLS